MPVRDVTSSLACLGIWGPRARDILASLCDDDLSNEAFPIHDRARDRGRGRAVPRGARDLRRRAGLGAVPADRVRGRLWDTLVEAGAPHGIMPAGYRAIDSLRLEKGYRSWGADITPEDSPLEAGLGFAVAFDKDAGFIGTRRGATAPREGVTRRLRCLTLADARSMTLGNEPVSETARTSSRG